MKKKYCQNNCQKKKKIAKYECGGSGKLFCEDCAVLEDFVCYECAPSLKSLKRKNITIKTNLAKKIKSNKK